MVRSCSLSLDVSSECYSVAMTAKAGRLTEEEMRAWKALRLMTRQLEAHLDRNLARNSNLSTQDYDVLSSVAPLPEHRWCTKKLVDHLQWSYSRLSHHLDRMQSRSLIRREPCENGTGADVVVTDDGMNAIRTATTHHLATVRSAFLDRLNPGELAVIERLSNAVLGGLPGPVPEKS